MHKDKAMREYRLWLHPKTVKQVRLCALLLGREDQWHTVMNDLIQLGVAYLNDAAKLNLAEWKGQMELVDLDSVELRILQGDLPKVTVEDD